MLPQVRVNDKHMHISLDVVSLFANVPLKKIVNIILKHIYKLIEDDIIKFYVRFVEDTSLVIKRTDISYVVNESQIYN